VLLKFHKETQFDFTGNPIEKDLKGKAAYSRCFKWCLIYLYYRNYE